MAIWNWDRLQQSIDKKDFKSFYILFGEEDFLQEEYLNLLKENILGDALPDFNLDVFYPGSDFKINKLIDAIETLPMMAERRLVILKHAQEIKAQDLENLIPILSKEHESTCFILTCSKLDKRQKFFKFADENK